jgi:sigma-54 specific flagellar transcriptional regulator A
VEVAKVEGPSVSANHALVWTDQGSIFVEDLGSRNGTWLLLPKSASLRLPDCDVVLELARSANEAKVSDEPPEPEWRGGHDYVASLVTALNRWAPLQKLDVEVRVVEQSDEPPPSAIPLARGLALDLVPRGTAAGDWSRLIEKLWRWVHRHNATHEAEERTRNEGMVLSSNAIRMAHREVIDAAKSEAKTLLLTGPSGAGKEMLAEVFHRHSGCSGPFVPLNCSLFSKDLFRAELFGAELGSFTGATRRIVGAVERARGGTLFLDEIAEMSEEIQPMLLRFLDGREIETLGQYGKRMAADVQVVAATNKDLRDLVRVRKFRADLWYRLSVHVVEIPALSERWDDIATYLETTQAPGTNLCLMDVLSPTALEVLRAHGWEGNFRELTNFGERLPRGAARGSIDGPACRAALYRGALHGAPSALAGEADAPVQTDFAALAGRATRAFVEDRGREPASWDDQKEWNEKYLKPLLFFHLSGAATCPAPHNDEALTSLAARCARRANADRGTAFKQLSRCYQRFGVSLPGR